MEALNNVATSTKKLVIILNDNKWSIAKNVGALPRYFNELITNPVYNRLNDDIESLLQKIPGGESLINFGTKWKRETKDFFVSSSLFEKYGVRYIGPIDGHDLEQVEHYLNSAKNAEQPVLLHVLTTKGKGYDVAIDNPERFHGASPYDVNTGKGLPSAKGMPPKYQDVMGQTLVKLGRGNKNVVGITAAMPSELALISSKRSSRNSLSTSGLQKNTQFSVQQVWRHLASTQSVQSIRLPAARLRSDHP